jgi:hypothetical protein
VIFGVAALLENTPFELYTLIRGGSLIQLQAATRNASTADLIVARDRTVVGRGAIAEVEHNLVHVTPSPAFGWVIAFDDRMARIVKVLRGVAVRRVVATANMAAGSA